MGILQAFLIHTFGLLLNSRLFWISQLTVVKTLSHKSQCVIVFGDTRSTVGAVSGHRAASVTQKIRFRSSVNQSNWMKGPRQEKMTNLGSRTGVGKPQLRRQILSGKAAQVDSSTKPSKETPQSPSTAAGELHR